jgi:Peptidase family S41
MVKSFGKIIILSCLLLVFSVCIKAQASTNPWLEDYEFLKNSMTKSYANLESAKIDIVALDKQTREQLATASSASDAKRILEKFLAAFNDGHLELVETNNLSSNGDATSFNSNTSSKEVCSYLGNERVSTDKFSLPFENLPNFKLISTKNDSFPIGILKTKSGKQFGILRISIFSPDVYTENCQEMWEKFRKTISTTCDENCLDNFSNFLANSLLAKLEKQLKTLQKNKIESLIIDIAGNGGGTNWVEPLARTIASKTLQASWFGFIRHPHWVKILESRLKLVETDLLRKDLSKKQTEYLQSAKDKLQQLIKEAQASCNKSDFWTANNQQQSCSMLNSTPLFASGVFPYLPIKEIQNLASKNVLFSPSEYVFRESVFKGKVFVLVDNNTASAAEYFAALLQDNRSATIIGEKTYGAGCGYVNGGVKYVLPNTKLTLKSPDCVRFRADGSNELKGIQPDNTLWNKADNTQKRLENLINYLGNL